MLDAIIQRDRSANGWQSLDEIVSALETNGFKVTKVPLYTDTLQLRSLDRLSEDCRARIIENWKYTSSLIVEVR